MVERSYKSERFIIKNEGEKLIGEIFTPGNIKKPYPGVLVLHGFPGMALIISDLISALVQEGYAAMSFHYRGCWGSSGKYSYLGAIKDARKALSILIKKEGIDKERIATVGHSFGGLVAINITSINRKAKTTVALCPVADIEKGFSEARTRMVLKRGLPFVSGLKIKEALVEWYKLANKYDSIHHVSKISPRPFLLIHGDKDDIIPLSCSQTLFERAEKPKRMIIVNNGDHLFSGKRKIVTKKTVTWLRKIFKN
ncbi:alpha/beta hydrolase [[Eubacterium] cellulosolvens]